MLKKIHLLITLAAFVAIEGRPRIKITSDLESAQNNTVCPFLIVHNVNEHRRPRIIKEIQCVGSIPKMPDCFKARRYSCVELEDTVEVHHAKERHKIWHETISVGCVCVENQVLEANSVEKPHIT